MFARNRRYFEWDEETDELLDEQALVDELDELDELDEEEDEEDEELEEHDEELLLLAVDDGSPAFLRLIDFPVDMRYHRYNHALANKPPPNRVISEAIR